MIWFRAYETDISFERKISNVRHGINRRRGFLLDHGSPVVPCPRVLCPLSSGGDIYIACPCLGEPVQTACVTKTARIYHRVDLRHRAPVDTRFDGAELVETKSARSDGRESGLIATGGHVPVVRCERVRRARSVSKAIIASQWSSREKGKGEERGSGEEQVSRSRVALRWPSAEVQPSCTMVSLLGFAVDRASLCVRNFRVHLRKLQLSVYT